MGLFTTSNHTHKKKGDRESLFSRKTRLQTAQSVDSDEDMLLYEESVKPKKHFFSSIRSNNSNKPSGPKFQRLDQITTTPVYDYSRMPMAHLSNSGTLASRLEAKVGSKARKSHVDGNAPLMITTNENSDNVDTKQKKSHHPNFSSQKPRKPFFLMRSKKPVAPKFHQLDENSSRGPNPTTSPRNLLFGEDQSVYEPKPDRKIIFNPQKFLERAYAKPGEAMIEPRKLHSLADDMSEDSSAKYEPPNFALNSNAKYEPPNFALNPTSSTEVSFDVREQYIKHSTTIENEDESTILSASVDSNASDTPGDEFRQFVFDKSFTRIETVAVEKSDPGAYDEAFVSAAVALTATLSSEKKPRKEVKWPKKKRNEAKHALREARSLQNRSIKEQQNQEKTSEKTSTRLEKSSTSPTSDSTSPPKNITTSSSGFTVVSNVSNGTGSFEFPEPKPFLLQESHGDDEECDEDDPFLLCAITEIDDTLWDADVDPFQTISTGGMAKFHSPRDIPFARSDDSLIVSIRKASRREPNVDATKKPDPSPKGIQQTNSDGSDGREVNPSSELKLSQNSPRENLGKKGTKRPAKTTKTKSGDKGPVNTKEKPATTLVMTAKTKALVGVAPLNNHTAAGSVDFPSKQPTLDDVEFDTTSEPRDDSDMSTIAEVAQAPSGVPSEAILGSMLFRWTHSESTMSVPTKYDPDMEDVPEVPPAVHTDETQDSTVSSVTEEASSFYVNKLQIWNKQAHDVLNNYHKSRKTARNDPNSYSADVQNSSKRVGNESRQYFA